MKLSILKQAVLSKLLKVKELCQTFLMQMNTVMLGKRI